MTHSLRTILVVGLVLLSVSANVERPWMNTNLTPQERAQQLLAKMSLDDKLNMVHGIPGPYVGNTPANPTLGIPSINLEDGPQGVADGVRNVTCWPSALTVVASWNQTLLYEYGKATAQEQVLKGTNVQLGPMVIPPLPNLPPSASPARDTPFACGRARTITSHAGSLTLSPSLDVYCSEYSPAQGLKGGEDRGSGDYNQQKKWFL